jgi:hypothetical protein
MALKLNVTHQHLTYAADINILEGSVHTIMENTEGLIVYSKGIGIELNANKHKHIVISRD